MLVISQVIVPKQTDFVITASSLAIYPVNVPRRRLLNLSNASTVVKVNFLKDSIIRRIYDMGVFNIMLIVGHIVAQCPVARSTRPINRDSKQCFNCQQFGHIAKNCTNEPQSREGNLNEEDGQRMPRRPQFRFKPVLCNKCGGPNHFAKDCKASNILCYNCQKRGHIARDCPLAAGGAAPAAMLNGQQQQRRNFNKKCHICGKRNHLARDCYFAKRRESEEAESGEDVEEDEEEATDSEEGSGEEGSESDSA
ncbi:hypothetical protein BDF20DRAFT_852960 [Mycotypha africana]|uniref:uncharacterized protein n=1 Tax=Mycotypha africana TaxID=64632 RepID=UPI002301D996|nr:uncharacterized protein BDF20DRAFT_852960 [Mycotypha africana]KAI8987945.1 hypothetical protein BDF20DRAFT_852960 [Mycotypha africana]